MEANNLVKNKRYRYISSDYPIEVIYSGKTSGGCIFESDGVKYHLSTMEVKLFIEELKQKALQKGKRYRYTAGGTPIDATYLYETINGYMFETDGEKRILSTIEVKLYIE
ncbi:MAG: hypothetical protein LBS20_19445 [Prevotella sp.]|jgi:hypothetical protein|nr:hypothetical protein [Prevotella sp.]